VAHQVQRFCAEVERRTGLVLVPSAPDGASALRIELGAEPGDAHLPPVAGCSPDEGDPGDERYSLTVDPGGVVLRARAAVGVARGLTTLTQLLVAAGRGPEGAVVLPGVQILDGPRFAWRELSFDVVRATFTAREVERIIDLLALYKLNVLHLHLTDDQAWRLPVGRGDATSPREERFFSREELRELVAYAEERFVTLVPEVDTPGHVRSLLALRPELDTGANRVEIDLAPGYALESAWLDPEHPATFPVIEEVLQAVAELFPGPYLHIGGDEAFAMPADRYAAYVARVRAIVRGLGKRPIGWQETARAGVGPDDVIQYWMSVPDVPLAGLPGELRENLAAAGRDVARALDAGARIVISPFSHCYLDVPYLERSSEPAQEERRARLGLPVYPPQTIEGTYGWEPLAALGAGPVSVAGVGAAIWCETVTDFDDLSFLLLPRLAGLAEKAWSPPDVAVWADHAERLPIHDRLWDQDGLIAFRSSMIQW
jgi:hexosaminidase